MSSGSESIQSILRNDLLKTLSESKSQLFWAGLAMVAIGILALVFPGVTSLSVELMIGWLLLFAGMAVVASAFGAQGTGAFFGQLLVGLLKLGLGFYLLMNPGIGMVALTLLLASIFVVDGAVQTSFAFQLRPAEGWGWVLVSALVSIGAGLLIAAGLPATSLVTLGALVGIKFLSTGIASIALSRSLPSPK